MAGVSRGEIKEWRPRASFLVDIGDLHSWAFSAMAELIDNAHDARATECRIQVLNREKRGEAMLLISDNGHGLSTDDLGIMLNLGHSNSGEDTRSHKPFGRYGTGFKSGAMHLAKDALVFTRLQFQDQVFSVGMLSQTYNKPDEPSVRFPVTTTDFETLMSGEDEICKAILSVFDSADIAAVQKQMPRSSKTKTVILLKRLNYTFTFDENDIKTSSQTTGFDYRESLRDYCKILYRKPLISIKIGNEKVEPLDIEALLDHRDHLPYKPMGQDVETKFTIGLKKKKELKNEELKNKYGIMMYWRNRLIRPFETGNLGFQSSQDRQVRQSCIGIVELDEILKPLNNKQAFDDTSRQYTKAIRMFKDKLRDYAKNHAPRSDDADEYQTESDELSLTSSSSDEDEEELVESENDGEDESESETSPDGCSRNISGAAVPLVVSSDEEEGSGDDWGEGAQTTASTAGDSEHPHTMGVTAGRASGSDTAAPGPQPTGSAARPPRTPEKRPSPRPDPSTPGTKRRRLEDTGDGTSPGKQKPKTAQEKKFPSYVFKLLSHFMLFFDPSQEHLETPFFELGKEDEIMQTVTNLVKEFGLVYVKPPASETYGIPPPPKPRMKKTMESWNSVTQIFIDTEGPIESLKEIGAVRGEERFHEVNITPDTMKQCLLQLCNWLSKSENNVLVGHSIDTRDRPALMYALDSCGLMDIFKSDRHVIGFLDTMDLFKKTHGDLRRHKLEDLATHFLKMKSFSHHNALGDALILRNLMSKWDAIHQGVENEEYKKESSRSMESAEEVFQEKKRIWENYPDLQPMVADHSISCHIAQKIAGSGLNLGHLRWVFDRGGRQGISDVLSEPTHCGVRVTKKETTVTQIVRYFQLNPIP